MNTTLEIKGTSNVNTFKDVCFAACEKIANQIEEAKNNIFAQFSDAFRANEQLLHLAIREADALASQTGYPHLIFPVLATEKIQSAAQWQARQQLLLRNRQFDDLAA